LISAEGSKRLQLVGRTVTTITHKDRYIDLQVYGAFFSIIK